MRHRDDGVVELVDRRHVVLCETGGVVLIPVRGDLLLELCRVDDAPLDLALVHFPRGGSAGLAEARGCFIPSCAAGRADPYLRRRPPPTS